MARFPDTPALPRSGLLMPRLRCAGPELSYGDVPAEGRRRGSPDGTTARRAALNERLAEEEPSRGSARPLIGRPSCKARDAAGGDVHLGELGCEAGR